MSEDVKKILIIEDEPHIAQGLMLNLKLKGHEVFHAENGAVGLELWEREQIDLVVLDLMMPIVDGHQVLRKIRSHDLKTPILILSAKDRAEDRVKALSDGVDDYLSKPFDLEEFLLRVERLLTKWDWIKPKDEVQQKISEQSEVTFGANKLDFINQLAWHQEKLIELTQQEWKLLIAFVDHPATKMSRVELLEKAWGYNKESMSRTVDNFVVRLRKYFELDPKRPKHFLSVRGVGYQFKFN
jgi:DNA-binding response OmpR family regulator